MTIFRTSPSRASSLMHVHLRRSPAIAGLIRGVATAIRRRISVRNG
jgi:hypothetical protein